MWFRSSAMRGILEREVCTAPVHAVLGKTVQGWSWSLKSWGTARRRSHGKAFCLHPQSSATIAVPSASVWVCDMMTFSWLHYGEQTDTGQG